MDGIPVLYMNFLEYHEALKKNPHQSKEVA